MKISVVIPTYNDSKTIVKCVTTILANNYDDFELIVVDDFSSDQTVEELKKINPERLKILVNPVNSGASFSRNRGIKESNGKLIILLDADAYVPRDWIERHAKAHKEVDADLIGGEVIGVYKTFIGRCDSVCNWWPSVPGQKSHYLNKFFLPSINLSIRKYVFQKIGYFNEKLGLGGEDSDFCFRALRGGLRVYFKSNLPVYHYDRNDLRNFLRHQQNWGRHAVNMRKGNKMEYHYLIPRSRFAAWLYFIPLAIAFTAFIIKRWVRYQPSVLLCAPIILLGKMTQTLEIKNSFKK